VRQILEKYLEPLPNFEALVLETDGGTRFAAIILAAEQPPINRSPNGSGKSEASIAI
jgi:hypothetical protein